MHSLDASFFHSFSEEHAPIPHLPPSPSPPLDSGAHSITFKAVHQQLHSFFQQINLRALHSYLAHLVQISKICFNFQVLLDLARTIFEEQSTLHNIVQKIMMITQTLLQCERCSVLLVDPSSKVWVKVIHLKCYTYNFDAVYSREFWILLGDW